MGAQKTRITISDDEKSWLESYSRVRGITMAEAIRKAITRLREQEGQSMYQSLLPKPKESGKRAADWNTRISSDLNGNEEYAREALGLSHSN
jgi:hypothetical protein